MREMSGLLDPVSAGPVFFLQPAENWSPMLHDVYHLLQFIHWMLDVTSTRCFQWWWVLKDPEFYSTHVGQMATNEAGWMSTLQNVVQDW
jgi:hypothetical protein